METLSSTLRPLGIIMWARGEAMLSSPKRLVALALGLMALVSCAGGMALLAYAAQPGVPPGMAEWSRETAFSLFFPTAILLAGGAFALLTDLYKR